MFNVTDVLQMLLFIKEGESFKKPFYDTFSPDYNKVGAGELPLTNISSALLLP